MISNNMLVLNQDGETLSSNVEVIDLRNYNFIKTIINKFGVSNNFVNININKSYILFCNILNTYNGFIITESNGTIILKYNPFVGSQSPSLPIIIKFNTSIENCKIEPYNNEYTSSSADKNTVSVFESI